MHLAVETLLKSLTFGIAPEVGRGEKNASAVGRLARVYEIARNAIEFRADHLVRRAAIERILRRQLVFGRKTEDVAEQLLLELKWAMYVTEVEEETVSQAELQKILEKLVNVNLSFNHDWVIGLVSAEIEEKLNPNADYHRFTNFAFNEMKTRVDLPQVKNLDLVLFTAVDRIYSQSDAQQVTYHIYKLVKAQWNGGEYEEKKVLDETWRLYKDANSSPYLNKVMAFVRRQMGPLVLLRDMYFMEPTKFAEAVGDKNIFDGQAKTALQGQLKLMNRRIQTATLRSLGYVFLTKMLLALVIEIPIDRALSGSVNYLIMGVNVAIPVAVMWILTASIKLPGAQQQDKLLAKTWQIVSEFGVQPHNNEKLTNKSEKSMIKFGLYYVFYGLLFTAIFALLVTGLIKFGYSFANIVMFLFFLSIISFFAYRIKQTAQVYAYDSGKGRTGFLDALMLPIVIVGGVLTSGVAKLNFLVFVFDFVLEAPFKMILSFLDSWLVFLSNKKDEAVG